MTRVALGLVVALLLSACSFGEGSEAGGENDAETFKATMDELARELLPDLQRSLGDAELLGMEATFYEPGGSFGVWKYTADGVFADPAGTPEKVLEKVSGVLADHGLEVTPDDGSGLAGRRDGVLVSVEAVSVDDPGAVRSLTITMVSDKGLSSRGDFAEDAEPEDYTAFVR